ncbi:response regulator [Desulfobacterales bacterium HSG17]|nr:response regulator [Desulfobacterales bacterium HSG17]
MTDLSNCTVLIVDDTETNIDVLVEALSDDFDISIAMDGERAMKNISEEPPDLILLDIMMPGMDGYEVCQKIKSNPATSMIPVVFLTAMGEEKNEAKGLALGAVDYITKPFSPDLVKSRVRNHLLLKIHQDHLEELVKKRTFDLEMSQRSAIFMLGEAGHYNDVDTGVHIWRMAAYSAAIAKCMGWNVADIEMLELAAPMHDTGKIGIPDSILKKPAKLDADEWKIMKSHSAVGYRVLAKSKSPLFNLAADVSFYHHEKWDGSGYPEGLKGKKIPESARIVAIGDVFDALTMKRPYKEPWPIEDAIAEIQKSAGSHFDPELVNCFLKIETEIRNIKNQWDLKEKEHDAIVNEKD